MTIEKENAPSATRQKKSIRSLVKKGRLNGSDCVPSVWSARLNSNQMESTLDSAMRENATENGGQQLCVGQAAEYLGVSTALVYQICDERRLRHYRVGGDGRRGKILIDREDLKQFLADCRVERHPLLG